MSNSTERICFLGGGNMASALIGGLIHQSSDHSARSASQIVVIEIDLAQRERLAAELGVTVFESLAAAAAASALAVDAFVLAVKPQQLRALATELAPWVVGRAVISIAAGIRATDLARWLGGHARIIRAMPNTPALVGAGISGLAALPGTPPGDLALAEQILGAVGPTLWFEDEAKLDAVTAISGSGPAYVFHFMEAMLAAATDLGLSPADARALTLATFAGAAKLAAQSDEPPAVLRERVTSPGGTTAAALATMHAHGVADGIRAGIVAAQQRSGELGDLLGRD